MRKELESVLDALQRSDRLLRDAIRIEYSPAAWDVVSDDPYLPDEGPEWKGLPGEHPLLPMIRDAIEKTKAAIASIDS